MIERGGPSRSPRLLLACPQLLFLHCYANLPAASSALTSQANTIRELVRHLGERFPGIDAQLLEDGDIRASIAVSIDGEIATGGILDAVGENSEVHFIPALSGGARLSARVESKNRDFSDRIGYPPRGCNIPAFSYNGLAGRGLPPFSRLATGRAEQSVWPLSFGLETPRRWLNESPSARALTS